MAKIKIKVKEGSVGKPLGEYIAKYKANKGKDGDSNKPIYRPKAKLNVHLNKWR